MRVQLTFQNTAQFQMKSGAAAWLFAFLLLCLGVSALGGLATSTSVGTWYQTLTKPSFNPPDWVFAQVWTTLFVRMAIAGWRVWRTPPTS